MVAIILLKIRELNVNAFPATDQHFVLAKHFIHFLLLDHFVKAVGVTANNLIPDHINDASLCHVQYRSKGFNHL